MSIEPGFVSSRQFDSLTRHSVVKGRHSYNTLWQYAADFFPLPSTTTPKGPAERENRLLEGFNDWLVLFAAANQLTKGLKPVSVAWKQIFTNRKIDE